MNWKPALAAAVVVIVAGALVGVLVGGEQTIKVKTVTRAAVTVTETTTAPSPTSANTTDTTAAPAPLPADPNTSLTYLDNPDDDPFSAGENVDSVEFIDKLQIPLTPPNVGWQAFLTTSDFEPYLRYQFELNVTTNAVRFVSKVGLLKGTPSAIGVKVSVHGDTRSGKTLDAFSLPAAGKGSVHALRLNVSGLSKLIFEVKPDPVNTTWDDGGVNLVLLNPAFAVAG